jgi:hypothetical protein
LHNIGMKDELLELYIFADTYDVPQLRRDILRTYIGTSANYNFAIPVYRHVVRAFKALPPTSPMIRFIIDLCEYSWTGDQDVVKFPIEFIQAVLQKIISAEKRYQICNPLCHVCDYCEGKKSSEGKSTK